MTTSSPTPSPKDPDSEFPEQYQGASLGDEPVLEREVRRWLSSPLSGLLTLIGHGGAGKTRMLYAVWREAVNSGKIVQFFPVLELFKHLQALSQNDMSNEEDYLKRLYRFLGVLLLDDLGAEKLTDFLLQDFYLLLAERERWGLATLITTNLSIKQIAVTLGDRIASRLAGGIVLEFKGKDYRLESKKPKNKR